jgi:hypothetical protein
MYFTLTARSFQVMLYAYRELLLFQVLGIQIDVSIDVVTILIGKLTEN